MSVEETAGKIASMEIRGALKIGVFAAQALLAEAEGGASHASLTESGAILKAARPTAVSLPNAVDYVLYLSKNTSDRKELAGKIMEFIDGLNAARTKIAGIGAHLIEEGDVILTHCNSTASTRVIEKAHLDGKKFKVYCCETRPRWQGRLTYRVLEKAGVDVTLIVDSAAHFIMKENHVDKVIVGADTVYVNGDVVNKIGTSQIALCAHANDVEFIVATESIKLSPKSLLGLEAKIEERDKHEDWAEDASIFNPAFDVTPKEYVHKIITEYGVIPPEAAYHILTEHYKWSLNQDG